MYVQNPETGRWIKVGGATYLRLGDQMLNLPQVSRIPRKITEAKAKRQEAQAKSNQPGKAAYILELAARTNCLQDYDSRKHRLLGVGTVGTVYLLCMAPDACHAVKLQLITTPLALATFKREAETQRLFYPAAPKVHRWCAEEIASENLVLGVIAMDTIASELDSYLQTRRSAEEMDNIVEGVTAIVASIGKRRYTHGDLALFNIAINSSGNIVLIDFDRASTDSFVFAPSVDWLRLIVECFPATQSKNTKKLDPNNLRFLQEVAVPIWAKMAGLDLRRYNTIDKIDELWVDEYEKYCRKAKVLCLPS